MISATRPPCPSTSALVASVVDIETSLMAEARPRPWRARHRPRLICRRRGRGGWSAPWPWRRRPSPPTTARRRCRCRRCRYPGRVAGKGRVAGAPALALDPGWHSRNGPQGRGQNSSAPLSRSRPDMKGRRLGQRHPPSPRSRGGKVRPLRHAQDGMGARTPRDLASPRPRDSRSRPCAGRRLSHRAGRGKKVYGTRLICSVWPPVQV